jgi:hypothetical protein
VDELMDLMDKYRLEQTVGQSVHRAKPQKCLCNPLVQQESSRAVPMSLPNELYKPVWLNRVNNAYKELVLTAENLTNFKWQMAALI